MLGLKVTFCKVSNLKKTQHLLKQNIRSSFQFKPRVSLKIWIRSRSSHLNRFEKQRCLLSRGSATIEIIAYEQASAPASADQNYIVLIGHYLVIKRPALFGRLACRYLYRVLTITEANIDKRPGRRGQGDGSARMQNYLPRFKMHVPRITTPWS